MSQIYKVTSFRGGISDEDDKGIAGSFSFGSGLDIRKKADSLSCQQALKEEGAGVIVDLIYFWVPCSDGNAYGFGNAGKIYKRTSAGVITLVYTEASGITGAAEWYSSTKTYLYWATATKERRKEIPGDVNWGDTTDVGDLTSATWHTQREAGGALIIANAGKLAQVGYDESYTSEALNLIPGNIAKTVVERNGRSIVGTARASNLTIGINAAIDAEVPLAQVGTDGELYFANMKDGIPAKRFPGGGKCNPGGVCNGVEDVNFFEWEQDALSWIDKQSVGNLAMFGVWGADTGYGGIYSYGRKNKNHPFVMNLEYLLDVTEIGSVANIGGVIVIGYKNGSSYYVKSVDSTTKATGTWEGLDFKAPDKNSMEITVWKTAEVFCKALPAGTSIAFYYQTDKSGTFTLAKTADGDTKFDTTGGKKAVFAIGTDGEIFQPKVVLTPTGNTSPEIRRIKVFFD